MKGKLLAVLFLAALPAGAQTTGPSIRGHYLGESYLSYINSVPGGAEQVQKCRDAVANPKTARKLKVNVAECRTMLAGVDNGAAVETGQRNGDGVTLFFEGGKLVKLKLNFGGANYFLRRSERKIFYYEEVVAGLTEKFGKPTKQTDFATQNGYGAVFHHRFMTWDTPIAHVTAYETDASIDNPITDVTVETPEHFHSEQAKDAARPNPLDK